MSMWSSNPASVAATQRAATGSTDLDSAPFKIVYPNADGTTGGSKPNYNAPTSGNSSDPYGGTPININVGNSASGLNSVSTVLGSGFSGLFDLIKQNTDKNNAWSAAQAGRQMDFQERMNQIAQEFNAGEAAKNRDWQEYMSNTAHQREVADLKAAGLNPVLSASGGNGASVGSGSSASISSPTGAKGDTDTSANTALVSLFGALINAQTQMYNANLAAKTNLVMADKQVEASMYGAQLAANANMYGSQMAYNASTFASQMSNDASRYASDKNYDSAKLNREFNYFNTGNLFTDATRSVSAKAKANSAPASSDWKSNFKNAILNQLNPLRGLGIGK